MRQSVKKNLAVSIKKANQCKPVSMKGQGGVLRYNKTLKPVAGERGIILIGLIVTMLIFSALGAALLPINDTSLYNQVGTNSLTRAYYMAESGYRWSATQFLRAANVNTNAADQVLHDLHQQTFTLLNNLGSFKIETYPYYAKSSAAPAAGSVNFTPSILGGSPTEFTYITSSGYFAVNDVNYKKYIYLYNAASKGVSSWTFTRLTAWSSAPNFANAFSSPTPVLPVGQTGGSAQSLAYNGSLALRTGNGAVFPPYNGTFQLTTVGDGALVPNATTYTYAYKVDNTLYGIRIFNDPSNNFSTFSVAADTKVILLKYLELHSTGNFGSSISAATRMVTYRGPISGVATDQVWSSGGAPQPEQSADLNALANNANSQNSTGNFDTPTVDGRLALHVTSTVGSGGSVEAYVTMPAGPSNPIYQSWNGAGSYLSYDLQVKVATGDWNGSFFENKPEQYCAGLVFRAGNALSNQSTYYGLSFMRTHNELGTQDGISDTMLPPFTSAAPDWDKDHGLYYVNETVTYAADGHTYKCILQHTSSNGRKPNNLTYWHPLNYNQAMVVLWDRSPHNNEDNWLAYGQLNATNYVVDASGLLKAWSTIMVRVVEAASLKLTVPSVTGINLGDTVTGGAGTAKVFRIINDSDGKVVLLLNNVEGTFTRPTQVGTYFTDAGWGYRSRDNYLWAFYTDTDNHPTTDEDPTNNFHLGQTRGTLNWATTDINNSWTAAGDNFKLVQWNSTLNTGEDSTLRLMGSGNEANAIIRTSVFTTGSYTAGSFPPEIGVVALGNNAAQTYFDDLAFYLRGAADGSGAASNIGFLPPVQE